MSTTKIKICGLFQLCDAEFVNKANPDYVGFVFCEKSSRYVTEEKAQVLRNAINPAIETVGVFVDAPMSQIEKVYRSDIVRIIQLHGSEDNAFIHELRGRLPEAVIWKAFKVCSKFDLDEAEKSAADMVLLDNGYGTGAVFDWSLIESFPRDFILAGGLTSENIPLAIAKFHPCGVDLSSSVETEGVKDKEKIFAVVSVAKRS
ncbi:MAG: trpF [Evtepia sp.]|jgi:phosphoribosylanthranilate isomerase|nr:trpF [Evtepia sp.]